MFFKTEIFNFVGENRTKKIFALWIIYILLTKSTSGEKTGIRSFVRRRNSNPLLFIVLRHLRFHQPKSIIPCRKM
ncbi:MAG: hypothetical protein DYG98_18095 [Haliscomenobacteraceae bacterium CHB4]|nr:hypothetical protein [Haliscomenobacteraceae bacterium CHB4]